jgi:hypothetical protein
MRAAGAILSGRFRVLKRQMGTTFVVPIHVLRRLDLPLGKNKIYCGFTPVAIRFQIEGNGLPVVKLTNACTL